jgi:hypothetical protein
MGKALLDSTFERIELKNLKIIAWETEDFVNKIFKATSYKVEEGAILSIVLDANWSLVRAVARFLVLEFPELESVQDAEDFLHWLYDWKINTKKESSEGGYGLYYSKSTKRYYYFRGKNIKGKVKIYVKRLNRDDIKKLIEKAKSSSS